MDRTNLNRRKRSLPNDHAVAIGQFCKQHGKLLLFVVLFLIGIFIGALVVKNASPVLTGSIETMFQNYVSQRSNQGFLRTFINSFASTMPFLLMSFFAGLFALGVPVAFGIPFFRGLGLGLTSGYLYSHYSLQGVAFTALLIVPHALISSFVILTASRESFVLSSRLFLAITPKAADTRLWKHVHAFLLRYLFFTGVLLISSLLDAIMSLVFMRFFSF